MAKLIKKSKCTFEAGHIVRKNELVGIPFTVWLQLNKLEVMIQQYDYLLGQPEYRKAPSLDGFERKSDLKASRPYADKPETPVLDRRVKEAMEFIDEIDSVNEADEINALIDKFGALIDWCSADKFVEGDCTTPIDTPMLGNPLELQADKIALSLACMVKNPILIEE